MRWLALASLFGCGRIHFAPEPSVSGDAMLSSVDAPISDATLATGFVGAGPTVGWTTGVMTTSPVDLPAGVVPGDLLLLHVTHQSGTVAAPAGWSTVVPEWGDGHCNVSGSAIYSRTAGASEPPTVAVTCITYCEAAISAFRWLDPVNPVDVVGPLGRTTAPDPCGTAITPQLQSVPPVTTTRPRDLVVVFYGDNDDQNIGGPSSQTLPAGVQQMYNAIGGQDLLAGVVGEVGAGTQSAQVITVVNENTYGWTGVQLGLALP